MTPNELWQDLLIQYPEVSLITFIDALALAVQHDQDKYVELSNPENPVHPLVLECIQATVEHLHAASDAYEASFK